MRRYLLACVLLASLGLLGCKERKAASARAKVPKVRKKARPPARTKARFHHQWFPKPQQAFRVILAHKPHILGIGEIHQIRSQRHIPSSIRRFKEWLLQSLWGMATDLIVETWVTTGQCGKKEVKITKQVKKVTQRPKKTENQIISLLRAAKRIGIQPHILQVHCKTYADLLKQTGDARIRQMILLVTRLLLQKARQVVERRKAQKQKAMIVLYGGALHNDLYPSKSLAHYSYVPKLLKELHEARKHFVELDLYVPEYLHDDEDWKKKPWYSLYLKQRKTTKTLLIRRAPRSYILLLPWHRPTKKPKKPRKRKNR